MDFFHRISTLCSDRSKALPASYPITSMKQRNFILYVSEEDDVAINRDKTK